MANRKQGSKGYSLIELIVGMMLIAIALALIVPSGRTTKDAATTKTTAEDLVARLRQARQAAITRSIPVAVAFPANESLKQTDEGFRLEGEVHPKVVDRWKISQARTETVYYTGQWSGPNWETAPVLRTPSLRFDLDRWFMDSEPPPLNMIAFTPSGTAVSNMQVGDGRFRILVAMGVSSGGDSLNTAQSAHTVWISPSGEVGLDVGIYGGQPSMSSTRDSLPIATYSPPPATNNNAPIVQAIDPLTTPGPKAFPNAVNPKTRNGNIMDLDSVLTLEVRVKDPDGDPPYFRWETVEAGRVSADGTTFQNQTDLALWGGRFANAGEVRMTWDPETEEWVGRDTWTPAPGDLGGNRYRLRCVIRDRRGGQATTGFPIDGNYLVTSKEPWIVYKTWNAQGRSELWKMTLDGLEHTRLVSFPHQNVDFGQWTPSGAEIIVGAADGIYRVSGDGGNLKRISANNLGGPIDGCCLSPQGDAVYYIGGAAGNKRIRKVYIDGSTGQQLNVPLTASNNDAETYRRVNGINDLSAAEFGSSPNERVVLLSSYFHDNRDGGLWGTGLFRKRRRYSGGMAVDAQNGAPTSYNSPGTWSGAGQYRQTPYGIHMTHTNDSSTPHGVHVLYGSADGLIHGHHIDYHGGDVHTTFNRGPSLPHPFPLRTGRPDVHHPKYATVSRDSMVFAAGRGVNSRVFYIPDINNPGSHLELPLHPLNQGADQPSVSRAR